MFIIQSKDSKRSPVASDGEEQEDIKCKRLKESRVCIPEYQSLVIGSILSTKYVVMVLL